MKFTANNRDFEIVEVDAYSCDSYSWPAGFVWISGHDESDVFPTPLEAQQDAILLNREGL